MSAPTRTFPDSADAQGWSPQFVAGLAGVTVEVRDCCGTFVDNEPDHCLTDGWVRDVDLSPEFYVGWSL